MQVNLDVFHTFGSDLSKYIHILENIQWRAACFIEGDIRTTTSVTRMLQYLRLKDLQNWNYEFKVTLLFKVIKGYVGVATHRLLDNHPTPPLTPVQAGVGVGYGGVANHVEWQCQPAVTHQHWWPAASGMSY